MNGKRSLNVEDCARTTRILREVIRPGLRVLFVGINPGIRSAETGHHFAGYSNRFWKLLHELGLVPEVITFEQDGRLPEWGYGITNIVARPTPGIDQLTREEYAAGARVIARKVRRAQPAVVARGRDANFSHAEMLRAFRWLKRALTHRRRAGRSFRKT